MSVPALTINKVCLSGLDAIALADQLIRAGNFDVVVAGGQESMTRAPHMLAKSRAGFKYGDVTLTDHLAYDGLHDVFTDQAMGALTELVNPLTRAEQDAFAARSHQRAAAAWKNGVFDDEVVPVSIPQRNGDSDLFAEDEGIRADTTAESLSRLRPAFSKTGSITAGNASSINDWCGSRRGDGQGQSSRTGPGLARRNRCAPCGGRTGYDTAAAAGQCHRGDLRTGRP